jgi:hypothetical protein
MKDTGDHLLVSYENAVFASLVRIHIYIRTYIHIGRQTESIPQIRGDGKRTKPSKSRVRFLHLDNNL